MGANRPSPNGAPLYTPRGIWYTFPPPSGPFRPLPLILGSSIGRAIGC